MRRLISESLRANLEDLPGVVLSIVSAATVAHGAMLLRNQAPVLMFMLGAGVAAATYVLDKRLIERLNSIRPQQNLLLVFLCWLPLFVVATAFAAVTAFSAIAPTLGVEEGKQVRRQHWARETSKLSHYLGALQTAVQQQATSLTVDIDTEQRTVAAARAQKLPVSTDRLRALRRRAAGIASVRTRVVGATTPPAEPPDDHAEALRALSASFQSLRALDADARSVIDAVPNVPAYELLAEPSTDLQSVVVRETLARSAPAILAWTTAALIEILPLVALFRGGRKIPMAVRLLEVRRRISDVHDVLRGRVPLVNVPMLVEPFQVKGVLRARLLPSSTARDCMPRLEEAIAEVPRRASGRAVIVGLSTASGELIEADQPLLGQLEGRPLVVRVEVQP